MTNNTLNNKLLAEGYAEATAEEQAQDATKSKAEAKAQAQALGLKLMAEFEEAKNLRRLTEQRWLLDLQQYRGDYQADFLYSLEKCNKSQAFYRITTIKVDTLTAKLMDLFFPARDKNWGLNPTPDPDLPPEVIVAELGEKLNMRATELIQMQFQALQEQGIAGLDNLNAERLQQACFAEAVQELNTTEFRIKVASERARKMESTIEDQLKEAVLNSGRSRDSWQQVCKDVIFSACLYGVGVLKGPLIEKNPSLAMRKEGQEWLFSREPEVRPYFEAVPIWNIYPDICAKSDKDLRYVWQMHLKTDKGLLELLNFPGFEQEEILEYLENNSDGDFGLFEFESDINLLNHENMQYGQRTSRRYRLYERWGYLTGHELQAAGLETNREDLNKVFSSNIWLLGDKVIKCVINPLEGIDIPYYFYTFKRDPASFWGEGLAQLLRTPQACMNAAVRAMQDNASLSASPLIGINLAALADGENIDNLLLDKLVLFDKQGLNIANAFSVASVPSNVEFNLTQLKFWAECVDEISTPRFNQGDGRISGAGQTASGLSMLMGASNTLLKDHIKNFDEQITAPFIRALFYWNMKFNPNEDIKGDFNVVAMGSQSMISKEIRAQQLPAIIGMLTHPAFNMMLKEYELLKVTLEQTDLPAEQILRSEEEIRIKQQELAQR